MTYDVLLKETFQFRFKLKDIKGLKNDFPFLMMELQMMKKNDLLKLGSFKINMEKILD